MFKHCLHHCYFYKAAQFDFDIFYEGGYKQITRTFLHFLISMLKPQTRLRYGCTNMDCRLKMSVICLYNAVNGHQIFEQLESKKDCVRFFVNKLFKIARYVLKVEKE